LAPAEPDQHQYILPVETTETILFFQLLHQLVEVMDHLQIAEQTTEAQAAVAALAVVAPKEMLLQQVVLVIHHQRHLAKVIMVVMVG
jgi:hypothetical protein